ncbi:MAG: hypothetical protein DI568_14310 [Sphingomonas sp.]|nr:MAG: hypothetical protein DI568_14310 [Sphingomonas sp.]
MMDDIRQHPDQSEDAPPVPRARRGARRDDPVTLGLKQLWADLEKEEVPDEFLDLLDQIDRQAGLGDAE